MSSQLGIDKFKFWGLVDELTIDPQCPLTVQQPCNAGTGDALNWRLLYTAGSKEVYGRKAFININNVHLDITPFPEKSGAFYTCHLSAGFGSDNNLEPLDRDGCVDAAHAFQNALKDLGVEVDLSRSVLSRVDIAKNVALTYPVATYAPAFAAIGTRKRVKKTEHGETGFYAGNKSQEIGFYDKGEEMRERGILPALCPVNTLRPELRFLKAGSLKDALSVGSLPELRSKWSDLKPVYKRHMERDIFRAKVEKNIEASLQLEQLAAYAKNSGSRQPWQYFKSKGMMMFLVQNYGLPGAKHFAVENFVDDVSSEAGKRQKARLFIELEQADFAIQTDVETREGHPVKDLYLELRRVVLEERE